MVGDTENFIALVLRAHMCLSVSGPQTGHFTLGHLSCLLHVYVVLDAH
ncbi:hypothetical protein SLEP1_g23609 [Rubroshorea leprosula]|uniref:Uncharacterized protein n=1 Tax=Rubroshorea leprosula TaxID=152421 RepID=A0AAV5JK65_9ROSI|nr:hypothetical protein SLEP1_g23609 [Rubroshorea leprosula]